MKMTKMDMAKVVAKALYNLSEDVTEKNKVAWRHAKMVARGCREEVEFLYGTAVKVLAEHAARTKG